MKTLEAYKSVIYPSQKNGFIKSETIRRYQKWSQSWNSNYKQVCRPLCKRELSSFSPNLLTSVGNFRSQKIVIFKSTSVKLGSLNKILYADFQNGLNLLNAIINECVDPFFPVFFETPCSTIMKEKQKWNKRLVFILFNTKVSPPEINWLM